MSCDASFRPGLLLCTPSGVLRDGRAGTDVAMATARRLAVLDLRDAEASCPKDLQLIRTEVERILAVHHDNIRFFPLNRSSLEFRQDLAYAGSLTSL